MSYYSHLRVVVVDELLELVVLEQLDDCLAVDASQRRHLDLLGRQLDVERLPEHAHRQRRRRIQVGDLQIKE